MMKLRMPTITGLAFFLVCCSLTAAGSFLMETTDPPEKDVELNQTYHMCDFFHTHLGSNPDFTDTPCENGQGLDKNGNCNTTQLCPTDKHCFVAWRNNVHGIEIVNSGCWVQGGPQCKHIPDCHAKNNTAVKGVYFCCCYGDYCTRGFQVISETPSTEEPEVASSVKDDTLPLSVVLGILIPTLILFVVCFSIGYYCHRKGKLGNSELDRASVNTPATASTGCTVSSFPVNMETPCPHLLAVKARGRFGKVWRAQLEDRIVAVKTFNLSEKMSWQNEQDIFCTPMMNTHPNILKFHTASSRGGGVHSELWLITEFYDRGSLADFLKVNTVDSEQALRIIETMACGMSFLHEDIQKPGCETKPAIAHRDFKSKNVLLDHNLNAIVADFGLAVKFLPGESPGESHGQVGTLRYMAPEVLEGAINFQKDAFLRIDMYAFGLVMWEILTRCSSLAGCGEYKMPFEEELGTNPTIDYMQEHVVEKKLRPQIREEWKTDREDITLCDTMEECWDHDAEARLSAGCVEQRMKGLLRNRRNELVIQTPTHINNRQVSSGYTDANAMNHINIQMNILSKENINQEQPGHGPGHNISSPSEDSPDKKEDTFTCQDDDHDSGTFATEDTLSHDGIMEPLLLNSVQSTDVHVSTEDNDSATSLLSSVNPAD